MSVVRIDEARPKEQVAGFADCRDLAFFIFIEAVYLCCVLIPWKFSRCRQRGIEEVYMRMKEFFSSKYILLFLLLFLFWILLSPGYSPSVVMIGLFSSALVTFFSKDIAFEGDEMPLYSPKKLMVFFVYIRFLIVEIFKANIGVAKIVLQRKMPLSPCFIRVPMMLKNDFVKVIYANSVTLTPGTLTVDVTDDFFVIHALTAEHAMSMTACVIEKYSCRLDELVARLGEEE